MQRKQVIGITLIALVFAVAGCKEPTPETETYTVSYDSNGAVSGTVPESQIKTHEVDLTLAANTGSLARSGSVYTGWNTKADGGGGSYAEEAIYTEDASVTMYAAWWDWARTKNTFTADGISFALTSVAGGYVFPLKTDDSETGTLAGTFWIGETEVTYELWHRVYTWAVDPGRGANPYIFAFTGKEGNDGVEGAPPTSAAQEPVTWLNWRDAVVWCNAFTEWYNDQTGAGYSCVYYSDAEYLNPLRTATRSATISDATPGTQDMPYIKAAVDGNTDMADCSANGFRLPTSNEWEFAARWRADRINTVSGYAAPWFTKGDSASGAGGNYTDSEATGSVAWYAGNSDGTKAAGTDVNANAFGLYDMSGNVCEFCFDAYVDNSAFYRVIRGGGWESLSGDLRVGAFGYALPYRMYDSTGFRIARTAEE